MLRESPWKCRIIIFKAVEQRRGMQKGGKRKKSRRKIQNWMRPWLLSRTMHHEVALRKISLPLMQSSYRKCRSKFIDTGKWVEHSYERTNLIAELFRRSRIQGKFKGNVAADVSWASSVKANEINRFSFPEVFAETEIKLEIWSPPAAFRWEYVW